MLTIQLQCKLSIPISLGPGNLVKMSDVVLYQYSIKDKTKQINSIWTTENSFYIRHFITSYLLNWIEFIWYLHLSGICIFTCSFHCTSSINKQCWWQGYRNRPTCTCTCQMYMYVLINKDLSQCCTSIANTKWVKSIPVTQWQVTKWWLNYNPFCFLTTGLWLMGVQSAPKIFKRGP